MPRRLLIEVKDTSVSVIFGQIDRLYHFGRLVDADDVAQFGPLCPSQREAAKAHYDQFESLAYTLALRAFAT